MHLKILKLFCDVVRQHSFSGAAAENELTQSAASQRVHQLEARLGVQLIDRSKRPWVLTPEGELFYRGARTIVDQYLQLEDRVRSLREEVTGRVKIASIYSAGLSHMNQHLKAFLSRYPRANVQVQYQHPNQVYELVEQAVVELGIISYPKSSRSIESISWRDEEMVVVCAPRHAFADRQQLQASQLDGANCVSFDRGSRIRHEIDKELAKQDARVNVVMEFDNIETIKGALEIEAGIAILPQPTVTREVELGLLVTVPLVDENGQPALFRPLGIIYRRGHALSPTAERFVHELIGLPLSAGEAAAARLGSNGRERQRKLNKSSIAKAK
jgi:DNA-binding transcriptional LysR family regulator